jgi:exonuclease SbcD
VTLGEKGDVSVELIPLKPLRDLRHITGKMADLLDPSNVTDKDDYIYVTLTDEDMTGDAMTIFQQTYSNTVKVTYENSHTVELDHVDISAIAENRTFDELISDFYREMYGTDISPEEMAVMRQTAREAGVLDETD